METATTDSDTLWQIGIDVHLEHRGRGLGAALTSQAARAVLDEGRVPYYGSSINNIASRRTAQAAGFYPVLGVGVYDWPRLTSIDMMSRISLRGIVAAIVVGLFAVFGCVPLPAEPPCPEGSERYDEYRLFFRGMSGMWRR